MDGLPETWWELQHSQLHVQIADRIHGLERAIQLLPERYRDELRSLGVTSITVDLPPTIRRIAMKNRTTILNPEMYEIRVCFATREQKQYGQERVEDIFEPLPVDVESLDDPDSCLD